VGPNLASTAWAFSLLSYADVTLWHALSSASIRRIASGRRSRQIFNPLWAVSTREFQDVPLLQSIASASISTLSHGGQQELAVSAWALA